MVVHNFPTYVIPLIGRAEALSQTAALLNDPSCRLLTLTGPGGIGKTRLAVAVAGLMMAGDEVDDHSSVQTSSFPDGACFVPLQPLTSPDFIVQAIVNALHFTPYGELDLKQQLFDYLGAKHLLLVLDNFEHLADGADLLPGLLANAPNLKVLVTSRERLRLQEEWLFNVDGLTFAENVRQVEWETSPPAIFSAKRPPCRVYASGRRYRVDCADLRDG